STGPASAPHRVHPAGGAVRPGPLPRRPAQVHVDRDGARLAGLPARVPADAAPLAAQHLVAGTEPLVRSRGRTHVEGTDQQPARAGGHVMKVSIIGGTGFIGSYLVDALVERG